MTEGHVRWYVFGGVMASFLIAYLFASGAQVNGIEDLRRACESNNRQRVVELAQQDALVANAAERAANPDTAREGEAALARAHEIRRRLIASVTDKEEPGSVRRDCEAAYDKPFPWSMFD